jgi:hypothetical protein
MGTVVLPAHLSDEATQMELEELLVAEGEVLPGSLGDWMLRTASSVERRNYLRLMQLLAAFEGEVGLEQRRDPLPQRALGARPGSTLR